MPAIQYESDSTSEFAIQKCSTNIVSITKIAAYAYLICAKSQQLHTFNLKL